MRKAWLFLVERNLSLQNNKKGIVFIYWCDRIKKHINPFATNESSGYIHIDNNKWFGESKKVMLK